MLLLLPELILLMDFPIVQNFHSLDVLDSRVVILLVFVTTKRIQSQLLLKIRPFVLLLHYFQNVLYLVAVLNIWVVHTSEGMENSPHHFWVVNRAGVVFDVQAKDEFV